MLPAPAASAAPAPPPCGARVGSRPRQPSLRLSCLALSGLLGVAGWATGASGAAGASHGATTPPAAAKQGLLRLQPGDVVAFAGGADVAAAQLSGHLETILAVQFREVRFRNFGWEGDTVSVQPRDVGFRPLLESLKDARVTVLVLQYGRMEAMAGRTELTGFAESYNALLDRLSVVTPRMILVTPPPFEKGPGRLPDLSAANRELAAYAGSIRTLARRRQLPLIDLFAACGGERHAGREWTSNGLQLTPRGHAALAAAFAQEAGLGTLARRAGEAGADGVWPSREFEEVRRLVVQKNELWLRYWRPQNWAFLGGDRTSQPSSRDHRDPKVRWFPAEMERFVPLIEAKEVEIRERAARLTR